LGKLVQELRLEKHIQFLGRIPREKTAPYYQEAGIFVMASLNEGMSNAMLEALASGLPIISTETGGAKELLKEDLNGFFVRMKNSEDLAEKINRLIANHGLREKMGEESRKLAEKMSWKIVAEKYFEEYKKINEK
jgi:glycosyltransferase involved in cell wall biosynthesis